MIRSFCDLTLHCFVLPAAALSTVQLITGVPPARSNPIYLTCNLNQYRDINSGTPGVVNGKVQILPNPNAKWKPWGPLEKNQTATLKFTLNEDSQTGSVFVDHANTSYKLPLVTFQPDSILAKKSEIVAGFNSSDTYTISRSDGSIVWEVMILGGAINAEYNGRCAKSEVKSKMF